MKIHIKKYVILVSVLFVSVVSNAREEKGIILDSFCISNANDTSTEITSDYSAAYEKALKRQEELINRKRALNDSVKIWNKELKKLEGLHSSIVKSNEKLEEKISQIKVKEQKSGSIELLKKKTQLLKTIETEEKEKASLESQLQEIISKLDKRNHQRENLGKIKDDVSKQIITENQDVLERSFSTMDFSKLLSVKTKCQQYTTDEKVKAFVTKINIAIKNKELYDNMVKVVNSAYKKYDIDRALASTTQIKGTNFHQQKEIDELKTQLTIFPDGLAAFKEFITELNKMRNGVDKYSMEWFQDDSKRILSKNNLGKRIEEKLKRVPYLNKKFEEYMNAFKAAPNKHSNIETEILNQ